jgi:hypothetical protein
MSKFSENESLNREHSFYQSIVVLAHLILVTIALVIFCYGIKSLDKNGIWSFDCLAKLILAAGLFWYYYRSVHNQTGIFYALDLWEQSLLHRRSDDELIRAYYRGERIFKDFREAEVFDGRIFPKPGGAKLTRGTDDDESNPQGHK